MGTSTDQARDAVIAARQGLLDEAEGMRRSAIEAINLPAKARDDPLRVGALAAGGAFVVLGGPRRLIGRIRRALLGAPVPKSLLPDEIEKAVQGMGKDSKAVRAHLEREFADYLEEHRADRERSMLSGAIAGVAGSLISSFSQRASRRLVDELLTPRRARDGSAGAPGSAGNAERDGAPDRGSGRGRSLPGRGPRRGR
jgi:hypothetical protein